MPDQLEPSAEQRHYVDEIIGIAHQLLADDTSVGDLKIVAGALREMAAAFRLFAPYHHVRKVSAFGSARTEPGDHICELAERFVMRLHRLLPPELVQALSEEVRDIVTDGVIEQRAAFFAERSEPEIFHLPRLVFRFDRKRYGRLRQLIDRINEAPGG